MAIHVTDIEEGTVWSDTVVDDSAQRTELKSRLAVILAINPLAGIAEGFGTGFIIGAASDDQGRGAVVVCTAAHVLHDIESRLAPHTLRNASNPFAPQRGSHLREAVTKGHLHVALLDEPTPRSCIVSALYILEFADLAYLVVLTDRPSSTIEKPQPTFLIDSQGLDVGDKILMFGTPKIDVKVVSENPQVTQLSCEVGWKYRWGSISQIHYTDRGFHTPVYETTVPMLAGMSGGPVILVGSDPNYCAVGVCSKDFSNQESFADCKAAGSSFFVPAAWIHGMPAPSLPGQPLKSLVGLHLLTDISPPYIWSLVQRDPLAAFLSTEQRGPRTRA
jgi:hypothetical protein